MPQIRNLQSFHQTLCVCSISEDSLERYQLQYQMLHVIAMGHFRRVWDLLHDPRIIHRQRQYSEGRLWRLQDIKYALAFAIQSNQSTSVQFGLLHYLDAHFRQQSNHFVSQLLSMQFTRDNVLMLEQYLVGLSPVEAALVLLTFFKEQNEAYDLHEPLWAVYDAHISELELLGHISIDWFVDWLCTPSLFKYRNRLHLADASDDVFEALQCHRERFTPSQWVQICVSYQPRLRLSCDLLRSLTEPIQERIELMTWLIEQISEMEHWDQRANLAVVIQYIGLDLAHHDAWLNSTIRQQLDSIYDGDWSRTWDVLFELKEGDGDIAESIKVLFKDIHPSGISEILRAYKPLWNSSMWNQILLECMQYRYADVFDFLLAEDPSKAIAFYEQYLHVGSRKDQFGQQCLGKYIETLEPSVAFSMTKQLRDLNEYLRCMMVLLVKYPKSKEYASHLLEVLLNRRSELNQKNTELLKNFLMREWALFSHCVDTVFTLVNSGLWGEWDQIHLSIVWFYRSGQDRWKIWEQSSDQWIQKLLFYEDVRLGKANWTQPKTPYRFPVTTSHKFNQRITHLVGPYVDGEEFYERMMTQKFDSSDVWTIIRQHHLTKDVLEIFRKFTGKISESIVRFLAGCIPEEIVEYLESATETVRYAIPELTLQQKHRLYTVRLRQSPRDMFCVSQVQVRSQDPLDVVLQAVQNSDGAKELPSSEPLALFFIMMSDVSLDTCHEVLKKIGVAQGKYTYVHAIMNRLREQGDLEGLRQMQALYARNNDMRLFIQKSIAKCEADAGDWTSYVQIVPIYRIFEEIPAEQIESVWSLVIKRLMDCAKTQDRLWVQGMASKVIESLSLPFVFEDLKHLLATDCTIDGSFMEEVNLLFEVYYATHPALCHQLYDLVQSRCYRDQIPYVMQYLGRSCLLLNRVSDLYEIRSFIEDGEILTSLLGEFPQFEPEIQACSERTLVYLPRFSKCNWIERLTALKPRKFRAEMPTIETALHLSDVVAEAIFDLGVQCVFSYAKPSQQGIGDLVMRLLVVGSIGQCNLYPLIGWFMPSCSLDAIVHELCVPAYFSMPVRKVAEILAETHPDIARLLVRCSIADDLASNDYTFFHFERDLILQLGLLKELMPVLLKHGTESDVGYFLDFDLDGEVRQELHQHIFRSGWQDLWPCVIDEYIETDRFPMLQEMLLNHVPSDKWILALIPLQQSLFNIGAWDSIKRTLLYDMNSTSSRELARLVLLHRLLQEGKASCNVTEIQKHWVFNG